MKVKQEQIIEAKKVLGNLKEQYNIYTHPFFAVYIAFAFILTIVAIVAIKHKLNSDSRLDIPLLITHYFGSLVGFFLFIWLILKRQRKVLETAASGNIKLRLPFFENDRCLSKYPTTVLWTDKRFVDKKGYVSFPIENATLETEANLWKIVPKEGSYVYAFPSDDTLVLSEGQQKVYYKGYIFIASTEPFVDVCYDSKHVRLKYENGYLVKA